MKKFRNEEAVAWWEPRGAGIEALPERATLSWRGYILNRHSRHLICGGIASCSPAVSFGAIRLPGLSPAAPRILLPGVISCCASWVRPVSRTLRALA